MGKVIRLTESDLTNIVKRVIRENEEQKVASEIKQEIIQTLSNDDLLFLGKLYNKLGKEGFEETVEDEVELQVSEEVNETISYSKGKFKVANEEEREKLQSILDKLNLSNLLNISVTSGVYGLLDVSTSYARHQPDDTSVIPLFVSIIAAIAATKVPDLIQNKNIEVDYKEHNPKLEKIIFKFISDYRKDTRENKTPYNYQNLLNKLTNYAPKNILMDLIAKYEKENNIKIPRIKFAETKKSNNLINRLFNR
jgi:hypothetical protein